jgi:hypothetical protein
MPKVRRNGPCPCGSGNKAKRCCYGIQASNRQRLLPPEFPEGYFDVLMGLSVIELRTLIDLVILMPERDIALQIRLPAIITPDIDRAVHALRDGEEELFDQAFEDVLANIDTDDRRIELAWAIIELRGQSRLPPTQAAVAVLELELPDSLLFRSSVAKSIAVCAGDLRTTAGLRAVTR